MREVDLLRFGPEIDENENSFPFPLRRLTSTPAGSGPNAGTTPLTRIIHSAALAMILSSRIAPI